MNIVVFSPHADDETLGAGGTLLKHHLQGDRIFGVNVTDVKEEYGYSKEAVEKSRKELAMVSQEYHMEKFYNLKLEPAGLNTCNVRELIQCFSEIMNEIKPQVVILPFPYDIHTDHHCVFEAVHACTKAFRYPFIEKILCMEIISETDYALPNRGFVPNYFVDISNTIEKKVEIMKLYKSEIKDSPFPRNEKAVRGLAKFRAAACNVEYAEAFWLLKQIEK